MTRDKVAKLITDTAADLGEPCSDRLALAAADALLARATVTERVVPTMYGENTLHLRSFDGRS